MAALLDISYESYRDLEWFDEEIVDALSFAELLRLGEALGLDLRMFFGANDVAESTFAELASKLRQVYMEEGVDLDTFEDELGWEVRRHLDEPDSFAELPPIALADVGARVGLDWRSFLPIGSDRAAGG